MTTSGTTPPIASGEQDLICVIRTPLRAVDPAQRERNPVIGVMRVILWLFYKLFYAVEWRYPERVPLTGPIILAPSHASLYDPFIVSVPVRRHASYFTREFYFKWPLGPIIRYLGAFPVNLRRRFDRQAYETAKRVLENGGYLCLFPEGTRTFDGLLGEIKSGVATLAAETGATIIPVSIAGAFEAWPRTRRFPRFCRKIVVTYHYPVAVRKLDDPQERRRQIAQINDHLQRALAPRLAAWKDLMSRMRDGGN